MPYKYAADRRAYRNAHRNSSKEKKSQTIRQQKHKELLDIYKCRAGCKICGIDGPSAILQFHHRDRNAKIDSISKMLTHSLENIKKELDKCDVLCSNCHLIVEEEYRQNQSKQRTLLDVLQEIGEIAGYPWRNVDNPQEYIRMMRGENK